LSAAAVRRRRFTGAGRRDGRVPKGVARRVFDRFKEDAITAVYAAQEEALRQGYGVVCTELLLLGILADEKLSGPDRVAKAALAGLGVKRQALKEAVGNLRQTRGEVAASGSGSLPFSDNAKLLFDLANAEAGGAGAVVGTEQLLLALGTPGLAQSGAAKVLLERFKVDGGKLRAALEQEAKRGAPPSNEKELSAVGAEGGSKKTSLDSVATDLTKMAREGLLDPVVGREKELQRIIQILLRKRKNNACLVGPPGVGKTAVAEGLAQMIADGRVPAKLRNKQLYSLDMAAIVAGTKYRGEFEERLKSIIDEVKSDERDVCLFIDEVHQLIGAGSAGDGASMDAANLLKPALARGELQVIGATTNEEYTKYIEKDGALERRFQRVACEEPSVSETLDILAGLQSSYEKHHDVLIAPEALAAAARWSHRYLPERFLPDKAVDLIDEASSFVQMRYGDAVEAAADAGGEDDELLVKPVVTAADIATVLSRWCGIPVERLTEDASERLLRLEETLAKRVVGQGEAVSSLARAVRRARAGLTGNRRPVASLYFAGPTGVGKTELCRVLASEYYADSKALIRLDMSEYSEQHSVSRLVGPPPGYVGFDDPRSGQLTEAVRRRPYSVVVLDEIEKAHPEVLNLLLQVLEDGRLTDGKGRTVTFANCIIVMTSNVGSREILAAASSGTLEGYVAMRSAVQDQLQRRFKPEFLNRIDELLVFRGLGAESLREIARLTLGDAAARAAEAHYESAVLSGSSGERLEVQWTTALEDEVLLRGADTTYGARPLRRAVQRCFEDPLAEVLVAGYLNGACGQAVIVGFEDGGSVVQVGGTRHRILLAASTDQAGGMGATVSGEPDLPSRSGLAPPTGVGVRAPAVAVS